jgi:hypothetical protein
MSEILKQWQNNHWLLAHQTSAAEVRDLALELRALAWAWMKEKHTELV